jgi:hypothetical protein
VQPGSVGFENTAIPIVISAALTDTDGSETLTLKIAFEGDGLIAPMGAVLTDGVHTFVVAEATRRQTSRAGTCQT